jgi:hypothetical protein
VLLNLIDELNKTLSNMDKELLRRERPYTERDEPSLRRPLQLKPLLMNCPSNNDNTLPIRMQL